MRTIASLCALTALLAALCPGPAWSQANISIRGPDFAVSVSIGDNGLSISASGNGGAPGGAPGGFGNGNSPFGVGPLASLDTPGQSSSPVGFPPLDLPAAPTSSPSAGTALNEGDDTAGTAPAASDASPTGRTFNVKATAEGLIGGITALGDRIQKWSEGAALPSRKALQQNLAVTYLANGRQANCQVLDVGPWNTNDPYWETAEGRPQAESGRDSRGRRTNGAGIDLYNATWYKLLALQSYDKRLIENVSGQVEWGFVQ